MVAASATAITPAAAAAAATGAVTYARLLGAGRPPLRQVGSRLPYSPAAMLRLRGSIRLCGTCLYR